MPIVNDIFVLLIGVVAFIYLLNPTAGLIEFIPDAVPFIGNLDEAVATTVFLRSLGHFNIDLLDRSGRNVAMTLIFGVLGMVYLVNPTGGLVEIIPDFIPVIGNLDEAVATVLVLNALHALGINPLQNQGHMR